MLQGLRTDKVRFGVYEADLRAGELRKHGIRIHLQRQPFKVLTALVENPGELVTREDLRQRIWGPEVVVDFDHSLGTAVNKLREALCDSADTPQYIETLAKRGFRFIAPVEPIVMPPRRDAEAHAGVIQTVAATVVAEPPPVIAEAAPAPPVAGISTAPAARLEPAPNRKWLTFGVLGLVTAAVMSALWLVAPSGGAPSFVRFDQITTDYPIYPGETEIERFPGVATDGLRVFFSDFQEGRVGLAYVLIGGGEVHRFVTPPEISRPSVADISRDGSQLLIRSMIWAETEQPFWIAPSTGGSARRLFNVLGHDAAWAPDKKSVLYASGQDLFLIGLNGGVSQKIASLAGRAYWLRYSPDGSIVRFTVLDPKTRATSIWEMSADGRNSHPLLPNWSNPSSECCGDWTAGGANFVFESSHSGRKNIWGKRESGILGFRTAPYEITAGPLDYIAPVPAVRGDSIFSIGANIRRELFHFNLNTHKPEPFLNNVRGAGRSEPAHRGDQIAWISNTDNSLWRGKADGSERVQLVAAPYTVYMARWSPDDRRLLVMAKQPGSPYQVYTVSADGGELQPILAENRNQADPDWSPAANAIVFGRLPNYAAEANAPKDISVLELDTKKVTKLRDSNGMFSPRWSPDGRYIAAMTLDQHQLMVFDRSAEKWSMLADGLIHNPVWSHDGKAIFFQDLQDDQVPIVRVSISDRKREHVFDRNVASPADRITFWGLAADGGPVASFLFYSADMYRLNWTGK